MTNNVSLTGLQNSYLRVNFSEGWQDRFRSRSAGHRSQERLVYLDGMEGLQEKTTFTLNDWALYVTQYILHTNYMYIHIITWCTVVYQFTIVTTLPTHYSLHNVVVFLCITILYLDQIKGITAWINNIYLLVLEVTKY